jgi:hypothetical protein
MLGWLHMSAQGEHKHTTVNPTTNLIDQCTGAHMNPDAVTWKHVKVALNPYNQRTYYMY